MLFNEDEAFESITKVHKSEFRDYIERIIGGKILDGAIVKYDTFSVDSLDAWSRPARIYNNDQLTWGRLTFTLASEARQERATFNYWYTVEPVSVDFRSSLNGKAYRDETPQYADSAEAASRDTLISSKEMRLAFFIDGTDIAQTISQLNRKLELIVLEEVLVIMVIATLVILVFGLWRVKTLAR